ncbi:MAG: KEOPS complex N(6)-L-threonylcarbamoyladenine synthase Kae1 [Thermoproteota archaeon]
MYVLGIESTAHTFGVGIVDENLNILANVNSTYVPQKGKGIHPREAAIHHSENASNVIKEALSKLNVSIKDIDAIAITLGPGLGPCLRTGATIARFLSLQYEKPLVPVNHAIAHLEIARYTCNEEDPLLVYIAGGNTIITTFVEGRYRIFGETQDIPLGNAVDYFGRMIGVGYPELINVEKLAMKGEKILDLPLVVKGQDVSYSGLITSALKLIKDGYKIEDVALSFIEYAYSMLCETVERAVVYTNKESIVLTGGTSRSIILKDKMEKLAKGQNVRFKVVPAEYAGDNGAMIALTGMLAFKSKVSIDPRKSYVKPMWRIDQVDIPWR